MVKNQCHTREGQRRTLMVQSSENMNMDIITPREDVGRSSSVLPSAPSEVSPRASSWGVMWTLTGPRILSHSTTHIGSANRGFIASPDVEERPPCCLHNGMERRVVNQTEIHVHCWCSRAHAGTVLLKKEMIVWQAQALHGKHVQEISKCDGELPACRSVTF